MERNKGNVNELQLEGFLRDLLFHATSEEDFDLLTEMLLDLQDRPLSRNEQGASHFEILKMSTSGTVSVGTIQGIEHAKKVVLCLQATESGFYLIYEKKTGSLIASVNEGPGQDETELFLH